MTENPSSNLFNADFPDTPDVVGDLVQLPGGLIIPATEEHDEHLVTTVQIQELNGFHEEALGRAGQSNNMFHFLNVLLDCGVVSIGEEKSNKESLLKSMLVGDRDTLVLHIRALTYGRKLDINNWVCPFCGDSTNVSLDILDDIDTVKLDNPLKDSEFTVPLKHGGEAEVRLPNGDDQLALGENPKMTIAERNTLLLRRCVESITDENGITFAMDARPSMALTLSIADRRKILEEITDRQPGPRYSDIKFVHESCGKEVSLALTLGDLFLG